MNLKRYFLNVGIALTQLGNALLGGDPDESLSSRMGKAIREGRCSACRWVCRLIEMIHPMHCAKSIEDDEGSKG